MPKVNISAPRNRAVKVTVYEPRQSPEQPEVILDTFELKAGEVREDYELRSATAAYRTEDLRVNETPEGETAYDLTFANIPDAQDGVPTEKAQAEIEAGRRAQAGHAQAEDEVDDTDDEGDEEKPARRKRSAKK